jgi:RimJ/RimL family protein N-acetyltransferase
MVTASPIGQPSALPLILTMCPARTVVGETVSATGAAAAPATQRVAATAATTDKLALIAAHAITGSGGNPECEDPNVPDPPLQIRPAIEDDRLPIAIMFAAVAEERDGIATEPPVDIEARAASWTIDGTLVAVADGEIVGSLHIEPSRHGFGEFGMAVAREWRGRGVGSALLAAAIEWARERGLHKLSLGVFAHNAAAIALYRKFGFVEEGRRVKQYRRASGELWDAVDMGLLL